MTSDDGLWELAMEVEKEAYQGGSLLEYAGVLGFAVGIETAFVAYADGAAVERATMSAHLIQAAVLGDGAILADVEVIADVDEASREVVVLELLGSVVLGLAGGGAVNDDVADGVGWHVETFLYVCEEVVLGGDLVATDGKRECFLDHSCGMHESKTIAPSTADAMVTIALNTGLFNRPLKLKRNLLIGSSDIKETTFDEVN